MTPVTTETSKPAPKAKNANEKIEDAAKAVATPKPTLTPSQVLENLADGLHDKPKATIMKTLGQELMEEFSAEATNRISIGRTLNRCREELGEAFATFRKEFVEGSLRKSTATIYNYMAIADAASYKFSAASTVAKTALFRIWGAEGCFDSENGKLSPLVDEAIRAVGGLEQSKDSVTCEQWAQKFVDTVYKLIRGSRQAQPGGKRWDAETVTARSAGVVKAYNAFITNQSVSAKKASALLTEILVVSMVEMSASEVRTAMDTAVKRVSERKADIKEHAEESKAA